jgi:membrane-bound lytic murein transglycosylase MltF
MYILLLIILISLYPDESNACPQFRSEIVRFTRQYLPEVRPSLIAGQIQQESSCNPVAKSKVGAAGLMQIMPSTITDVIKLCSMPGFDPLNPRRAVQGGICYDSIVRKRVGRFNSTKDLDVAMLRGYNGGAGWILREKSLAITERLDSQNAYLIGKLCPRLRSIDSCNENLDYPVKISKYQVRFYSWD